MKINSAICKEEIVKLIAKEPELYLGLIGSSVTFLAILWSRPENRIAVLGDRLCYG